MEESDSNTCLGSAGEGDGSSSDPLHLIKHEDSDEAEESIKRPRKTRIDKDLKKAEKLDRKKMEKKCMKAKGVRKNGNWLCKACSESTRKYKTSAMFLHHLITAHGIVLPNGNEIIQKINKIVTHSAIENSDIFTEYGKRNQYGTWLCNNCSAMHSKKSAFIIHLKRAHDVDITEVKIDCPSCDEYFITHRALNDHMNSKHISVDALHADEKEKEMLNKYGRRAERNCWRCSMCTSSFMYDHTFIYHLKKMHNIKIGKFQYKCPHCELEVKSGMGLRAHIKRLHSDKPK